MNWPKDFHLEMRTRPGTWTARMHPKSIEWHRVSGKRYSIEGAETALRVLRKRHSGSDWRIASRAHLETV
jgi:hypothetical protein